MEIARALYEGISLGLSLIVLIGVAGVVGILLFWRR
jgi:hypothetical protein